MADIAMKVGSSLYGQEKISLRPLLDLPYKSLSFFLPPFLLLLATQATAKFLNGSLNTLLI